MTTFQIRQAVRLMRCGGVIAYPTEAVWGLGCDPHNYQACQVLLQIKQRPVEKGMILVAADMQQLDGLLEPLTAAQRQCLAASWPGPHTWLVPDPLQSVPWWVRGDHHSVAVRVSAHPVVKALCEAFGGPVVSTSANRAGKAPATSRVQLEKAIGRGLDYVLPGKLGGNDKPSTISDLLSGQRIR
ncbi:MAG: Sua5/YciO/YrdC/YwlC family protein [Pseudomonadales bacterium]|nr:Sua5/YciO/YrdC/YwlC family protein [Pseudomonadales bacterium]